MVHRHLNYQMSILIWSSYMPFFFAHVSIYVSTIRCVFVRFTVFYGHIFSLIASNCKNSSDTFQSFVREIPTNISVARKLVGGNRDNFDKYKCCPSCFSLSMEQYYKSVIARIMYPCGISRSSPALESESLWWTTHEINQNSNSKSALLPPSDILLQIYSAVLKCFCYTPILLRNVSYGIGGAT